MPVRKKTHDAVASALGRSLGVIAEIQEENAGLQARVAELEHDFRGAIERINKLNKRLSEDRHAWDKQSRDLIRDSVDLIQHSGLFPTTDPAAPAYGRLEIEQRLRRIMAELER